MLWNYELNTGYTESIRELTCRCLNLRLTRLVLQRLQDKPMQLLNAISRPLLALWVAGKKTGLFHSLV